MRWFFLGLIRIYQTLTQGGVPHCRFTPTCSQYAYEAIVQHGILKGIGMGMRRLLKCHPFHPGGIDPVPPHRPEKDY